MQKSIIFAFLILLSFSTIAQSQKIEVKDGITYIHNKKPKWGKEPKVKLELIQEIGGIDVEDRNYMMSDIRDVFRDSYGRIYVADTENNRIKQFNKNGKFIKNIGRRGKGPGEFILPQSINVDNNNDLYVYNGASKMILILNPEGVEIKRFNVNFHVNKFRILSNDRIIAHTGVYSDVLRDKSPSVFYVYDFAGNLLYEFGEMFPLPLKGRKNSYAYSSGFSYDVDENGNIYCAHEYINKIEKLNNKGKTILIIDRKIKKEPDELFYEYSDRNKRRIVFPTIVSRGMGIDYKKRIWVTTFIKQREPISIEKARFEILLLRFGAKKEQAVFEVFDKEGILLGLLPQPCDIFYWRMFGDRLYIVDENMVSVKEYKIVDLDQ